jgi:hypothetical protein
LHGKVAYRAVFMCPSSPNSSECSSSITALAAPPTRCECHLGHAKTHALSLRLAIMAA